MRETSDTTTTTRRNALKAIGAGTLSVGLLSGPAAARPDCELEACTEEYLLEPPALSPAVPVHWDGESIKRNKPLVKVGAGIEVTDPELGTFDAPFAFDPIVTCVREGTTIEFKWLNQKSVTTMIPETVHHNVVIFQFSDNGNCTFEDGSFVSSGAPVGFNPPAESEPLSFKHTFNEAGDYPFFCEPHGYSNVIPGDLLTHTHGLPPNALGMRGAVIVR